MSQQLTATNATGNSGLQTACRPIYVEYTHAGGSPVSAMILAQVQVEIDGEFTDVGRPLVVTRNPNSTQANPKYLFDIAPILKAYIESGDYVDGVDSIFSAQSNDLLVLSPTTDTTEDYFYKNAIKYRVQARAYYLDSNNNNFLTLNEDDDPITNPSAGTKFAVDMFIKDEFLSESKYYNLPAQGTLPQTNLTSGSNLSSSKFLTNCPTFLKRKIELGSPLTLAALAYEYSGAVSDLVCSYTDNSSTSVSDQVIISQFISNSTDGGNPSKKVLAANLTPEDGTNGLFAVISATEAAIGGKNISFRIKQGGNVTPSMLFELYDKPSGSNSNLSKLNPDFCSIYFINDFNVLDYYLFDSFLEISHSHSKSLFKTGFKDYTSSTSSKRGVSAASTEEVYTCSSLVNRETSDWLSEIYRSKKVYLYDRLNSKFIPVIIIDGDVTISYANSRELKPFTISFIKDVHSIKY